MARVQDWEDGDIFTPEFQERIEAKSEPDLTDADRQRIAKGRRMALRRAITRQDHRAILIACERAREAFDQPGMYYPDAWHDYPRALEDAIFDLRRERPGRAEALEAELTAELARWGD